MQNLVPTPLPIPPFTPVPRKLRVDGWTEERQRGFIAALAETGSVRTACRRLNMAATGAYQLRMAQGAESFRAAWDAALAHGIQNLVDIAFDRAVNGVEVPIFHKGERCGERYWYNDKLLMFLLKHHLPQLYGALAARAPSQAEQEAQAEEMAEAARLESERWVRKILRAFSRLATQHRVKLRQSILALYSGDPWGAAHFEHEAREIEKCMTGHPDNWDLVGILGQFELDRLDQEAAGHPDNPAHCRDIDDILADDPPDPDCPSLSDFPRDEDGVLIPVLPLPAAIRAQDNQMCGGPTAHERERVRRTARERIREIQAEFLAAYDEGGWAKWKAGSGAAGTA